jgi:hypothetical protein
MGWRGTNLAWPPGCLAYPVASGILARASLFLEDDVIRFPLRPVTACGCLRAGSIATALVVSLGLVAMVEVGTAEQVYYVDNQSATCSPTGPGTEAQPYCTISAAVAAHKGAGITIVVRPGVYREAVAITASGSPDAPYVIRAEGPGVVIDGADDLSGESRWTRPESSPVPGEHGPQAVDGGWLAADVTWAPQQVFVDGRRLRPSAANPGGLPADGFTWVPGEGLYVSLGGENPGTHKILVGRRLQAFRIGGRSWVTIEGFEVERADDNGINVNLGCSDLVIARNRVRSARSYGIRVAGGLRVTLDGNSVSESGFHGIGLTAGSTGCVVRSNDSFQNAQADVRAAKGILLQDAPFNILVGNRTYENQDTGIQINPGSDDCLLYNNRSWRNGDHGFDHLDVARTTHVHNVAHGNLRDGISVEGTSPGTQVFNCISVDNGLTTDRFNLWVNGPSTAGFRSDYNILWNSTDQEPVKYVATKYHKLSDYSAASGQDQNSLQANPLFVDPYRGDFLPLAGSPAIDAGNSGVPNWPAYDGAGHCRYDDPATPDAGTGPVTFADIGATEFVREEPAPIELPRPGLTPGDRDANLLAGHAVAGGVELALSRAFPNPSRGPVAFALDLPRDAEVEWAVYDLQGRTVWSEARTLAAGRTELRWDGTSASGVTAATGIYMVRARVDGTELTRRLIRF